MEPRDVVERAVRECLQLRVTLPRAEVLQALRAWCEQVTVDAAAAAVYRQCVDPHFARGCGSFDAALRDDTATTVAALRAALEETFAEALKVVPPSA